VPAKGQCSVPADPQWTPQENFVWQHVCVGAVPIFNIEPGYGGALDPKGPKGLPANRILRPEFLASILIDGKYSRVITPQQGVNIIGARFADTLNLSYLDLHHNLGLSDCLFDRGELFVSFKSTYSLMLSGSKVVGPLYMPFINVAQNLYIIWNSTQSTYGVLMLEERSTSAFQRIPEVIRGRELAYLWTGFRSVKPCPCLAPSLIQ
jgi:hypothetical protein